MAWNAVFGRLGSVGAPDTDTEAGTEDEWEDVDAVRSAEIERKKRILKRQIARAAARNSAETSPMPTTKDGGKEAPKTRRTSIGRPAQKEGIQNPVLGAAKRKRSIDSGQDAKMSEPSENQWEEMKKMLGGISQQMAGVKTDIEESKKDLAERIEKGNEETRQLKARMDDNDRTFADRVTAVVASLPGFGGLS